MLIQAKEPGTQEEPFLAEEKAPELFTIPEFWVRSGRIA